MEGNDPGGVVGQHVDQFVVQLAVLKGVVRFAAQASVGLVGLGGAEFVAEV